MCPRHDKTLQCDPLTVTRSGGRYKIDLLSISTLKYVATIHNAVGLYLHFTRMDGWHHVLRSLYRQFPVNAITGKYIARGCKLMGFPTFCPLT